MWSILFKVILFVLIVISPILISMLIYFLYFYFVKNMRFKEGDYQYVGYGSILKRIVIDFPRQFVLDAFNREPDNFKEYRCTYYCWKTRKWKKYYINIYVIKISKNVSKIKNKNKLLL